MLAKIRPWFIVLVCGFVACGLVSTAAAKEYSAEKNEYVAYLKKHVDTDVMERWRGDVPVAGLDDIKQYLTVFDYWAQMAEDAGLYKLTAAEQALLTDFKAKIVAIQGEAFPKIRKALEIVPVEELGKPGVVVTVLGDGMRNVVFREKTSAPVEQGPFFDDAIKELLTHMRFTKADYETAVINGMRVETFYVDGFADTDLAVFNSETKLYRPVK